MSASDNFVSAFEKLVNEEGVEATLIIIAGTLINLAETATRMAQGDPTTNLAIQCEGMRSITIHAEKKS